MKKILVVGAGPCGLMASYQIKKNNPSDQVILLDKDEFGKRIKVSGNGRCNFSNINVYRVSFRSKEIAINKVAEKYRGGGHAQASGGKLLSLDEVEQMIKDLDDLIK